MSARRTTLGLAAAVALALGACSDATESPTGEDPPRPTGDTGDPTSGAPAATGAPTDDGDDAPDAYQIGDTIETGNWTVTVASVELYATDEVLESNPMNGNPADGTGYVILDLAATNTGGEEAGFHSHVTTALTTPDGEVLGNNRGAGGSICLLGDDEPDVSDPVGPGDTVSGRVCLTARTEGLDTALLRLTDSRSDGETLVSLEGADHDDTPTAGSPETPHEVGEDVETNGWRVTVNDVDTDGEPTSFGEPVGDPPAGMRWLLVDVTLTNVDGESSAFLDDNDYFAVTSDGERHGGLPRRCSMGIYDGDPFFEEIPSGESADAVLCVEVPEDLADAGLTLQFTRNYLTADTLGTYVRLN